MKVVEDTEGFTIGIATHLLLFKPEANGAVEFQIGHRPVQRAWLGAEAEGRRIAGIIQPLTAVFYDCSDWSLVGIHFMRYGDDLTVLFGPRFGDVYLPDGVEMRATQPHRLIRSMHTSLHVQDKPPVIGQRFLINIHTADFYNAEVNNALSHPEELNYIEIRHCTHSGEFQKAFLEVISKTNHRVLEHVDIDEFPIRVPDKKRVREPQRLANAAPRIMPERRRKRGGKLQKPLPKTKGVPVDRLVEIIESEEDEERRWLIIEENLLLKRPERTYFLATRFPELISEHIQQWDTERVVECFATQSSAVLETICRRAPLDMVLALSEKHAERDRIMDWLRDREVERLLRLPKDNMAVENPEIARDLLFISKDAEPQAIKRVWRTLLSFLNADYGRHNEKAIHQKKDAIAKKLQTARNLLTK